MTLETNCFTQLMLLALQALEDEQRKASKTVRAAKASADADVMKLKQALTEAEQQRLEAVRQCEAEGHRSAVKIAQAGRNLKSAKQEAAEAQKQAEVGCSSSCTCAVVRPAVQSTHICFSSQEQTQVLQNCFWACQRIAW